MRLHCKHFLSFYINKMLRVLRVHVYTVHMVVALISFLFAPGIAEATTCERVISLAPSITQTLVALNLTDRIVAVSAFETGPPAVKKLPVITFGASGGLNLEALLAYRPDTVFTVAWHGNTLKQLDDMGIKVIEADSSTLASYFTAVSTLAGYCQRNAAGKALIARLRHAIGLDKPPRNPAPDTLLVVGSAIGFPVYAAGLSTIYSAVLERAGCGNILRKIDGASLPDYPPIGREGLIRLAPQKIIILAPAGEQAQLHNRRNLFTDLPLPAVRNHNIHVFSHPNALIPGPDLPQTARALQRWCQK